MTLPVAAYDFGRSNCRGALVLDGRRLKVVTLRADATAIDAGGPEIVAAVLRRLAGRLEAPEVSGAAVGLAGLTGDSGVATRLSETLRDLHGDVRTVVVSDVTIAHAGALDGRPGVVVLAGTGAVTLGVSPSGHPVRVDGWGYLLGDAGGGFSIGRAGLAAALAQHDGRGAPTRLTALAEDRFGPLTGLPRQVHTETNSARLIASFADAVADAARDGDEVARDIWSNAADELARSAAAAVQGLAAHAPLGDDASQAIPVSWAGGIFANSDLLVERLRTGLARLSPTPALCAPEGDALDGAALLARNDRTCHESLRLDRRGGGRHGANKTQPGRNTSSQRRDTCRSEHARY